MLFGLLGDIHGEFDALDAVMRDHPDVAFWLSVGDVASDDLRYPEPVAPLYWIQGNNEDFDAIARGLGIANLHFLPNGTRTPIPASGVRSESVGFFTPDPGARREKTDIFRSDPGGVMVGALGGTFAPTWYETPASELPHLKPRDDKRRHFVREQVEALEAAGPIDVLLTHEAPRPFIVQAGARRVDAGKTPVNELLAALKPRLHVFGHHHRFSDAVRSGVRSIGLDVVTRSWVLVDGQTFEITKIDYH